MSDKFKLTEGEITKTLAHSPYALSDSPYQSGLGAGQIKKYFYDFIRFFAKCLNLHLEEIGKDVGELEKGLKEACDKQDDISESLLSVDSRMEEISKGTGENAKAIESVGNELKESLQALNTAVLQAQAAYNLASGKSKVHIYYDFMTMFYGLKTAGVNKGDFILILDRECPDFVVSSLDPTEYTYAEAIYEGNVDEATLQMYKPGAGLTYCLGYVGANPVVITGIESGIDTSAFATKEELNAINYHIGDYEWRVNENTERINSLDSDVEIAQELAQSAFDRAGGIYEVFSNGDEVVVSNGTMYVAPEPINELLITFPSDNFTCGFQFTFADSGTVGVAFGSSSTFPLKFIGDPPTFANGETWELNICNGVVVGGKIG